MKNRETIHAKNLLCDLYSVEEPVPKLLAQYVWIISREASIYMELKPEIECFGNLNYIIFNVVSIAETKQGLTQ